MNQILVTKKLYITPELKRKKKIYKFDFFLSVFLAVVLISLCIYAEYDKSKSEAVSQEILASTIIEKKDDTTTANSDVLMVVLDDSNQNVNAQNQNNVATPETKKTVQTTDDGYNYTTVAVVEIPSLGLSYPVLDGQANTTEETEALLKISPTKFWGPSPNKVGNFCIVGHNYRNSKFFSKVPTMENGEIIKITDLDGKTIKYEVYNKYTVDPTDVNCTSQLTNGKREITLITCTDDSKQRVIIKAIEVK